MRRLLSLLALVCLAGAVASASPMCLNGDTLQNYISNYATQDNACLIGDKLFWGFTLANGLTNTPGAGPTTGAITVGTIPGDGLTNIGISFNSGSWAISQGFTIDQNLSYNVTTFSSQPLIKDATLVIAGTLVGTGGTAKVIETFDWRYPAPADCLPPGSIRPTPTFLPARYHAIDFQQYPSGGGARLQDLAHISLVENDFRAHSHPNRRRFSCSVPAVAGLARRKYFAIAGGLK